MYRYRFKSEEWLKKATLELSRVFPQVDPRIIEEYTHPLIDRLQVVFGEVRNIARLTALGSPGLRNSNCLGNMRHLEPDSISDILG
jgi:hypothetical protein